MLCETGGLYNAVQYRQYDAVWLYSLLLFAIIAHCCTLYYSAVRHWGTWYSMMQYSTDSRKQNYDFTAFCSLQSQHTCYTDGVFQSKFPSKDNEVFLVLQYSTGNNNNIEISIALCYMLKPPHGIHRNYGEHRMGQFPFIAKHEAELRWIDRQSWWRMSRGISRRKTALTHDTMLA